MAAKNHDHSRQERIDAHVEWVAKTIGADPESVMTDGNYGVSLTPTQMDKLIEAVRRQGYQNAIDLLRANGEAANVEGPERNLTQWAVMVSAASFLEGVA